MNFLRVLVVQAVDLLLVGDGAERRDDQRLRLAALEDGRAVRARQHADLAVDGANLLGVAAVDALAVEGQIADDAFLQGRPGLAELRAGVLGRLRPGGTSALSCALSSSTLP